MKVALNPLTCVFAPSLVFVASSWMDALGLFEIIQINLYLTNNTQENRKFAYKSLENILSQYEHPTPAHTRDVSECVHN